MNPQVLRLRFFDVGLRIESDSSTLVDLLRQMYHRFEVHTLAGVALAPVQFQVWTGSDNPWNKPVIVLDGQAHAVANSRQIEFYAYQFVLHTVLARVKSYFLVHAGVVSWNDRAVIIPADVMHGKTTLVLELVQRGFKFLSDELAAIDLIDHYVYPFPRALLVRPGTLELVGIGQTGTHYAKHYDKRILDIEELVPNSIGKAAPIGHVIVLSDPVKVANSDAIPFESTLILVLDRLDEKLIAELAQISSVVRIQTDTDRAYPELKLTVTSEARTLKEIEIHCNQNGISILSATKFQGQGPSFDSPAKLEPIASSQAAMEFLRRFQGGRKSALVQVKAHPSPTRMFVELASLLAYAKCYQLKVGPLSQMADLVCRAVGA